MKIESNQTSPQPPPIPRIWERMSSLQRRQLAGQLAAMIRQLRQSTLKKERRSDE